MRRRHDGLFPSCLKSTLYFRVNKGDEELFDYRKKVISRSVRVNRGTQVGGVTLNLTLARTTDDELSSKN